MAFQNISKGSKHADEQSKRMLGAEGPLHGPASQPPWFSLAAVAAAGLLAALLLSPASGERAAGDTLGWEASSTLRSGGATAEANGIQVLPSSTARLAGADEDRAAPKDDEGPTESVPLAYPVDLPALRAKLPDNLYWQLGAPTTDPDVLSQREEEEWRMNQLFGKVQSNTASEEEIQKYYDRRKRISEDYIEFANLVSTEYGAQLPENDRGLFALSVKMHRSRLAALPREVDDALRRKKIRDERRGDLPR